MRMNSRHKDKTHNPLANWLRKRGWTIYDVNQISGFVDAIGVLGGRVLFIEFKSGTLKPRPHQAALHEHLRAAGAEVAVFARVEDLEKYFERPFTEFYDAKTAAGR